MEGTIAIGFGSILVAAFVFYFVIKAAVRGGINESMLFTDEQRKEQEKKEYYEMNNLIKKDED